MGESSEKAIALSFIQFIQSLNSPHPEKIETSIQTLTDLFSLDLTDHTSIDKISYQPTNLKEIFSAGIKSLGAQTKENVRNKIVGRSDFKKFLENVKGKGIFKDFSEDSEEYNEIFEKVVQKFSEKMNVDEDNNDNDDESDSEAEKKAEAAKLEGNEFIKSKMYKKAEKSYSKAIEICPNGENSHIFYCNRAAARCFLNKWEDAISDCLSSIDLNENYAKAFARLGFSYYNVEDWEASAKAYKKACELDPSNTSNFDSFKKAEAKAKNSIVTEIDSSNSSNAQSSGGFDMSNLAGMMGGQGGGGLAGLMNNPEIAKMAQDPAFIKMAQGMMQNPDTMRQMQNMMASGGSPDLNAMAGMMGAGNQASANRSRGRNQNSVAEDKEMKELKELMQREGPMAVMQKVGSNPRLQAKVMELMQKSGMGGMS